MASPDPLRIYREKRDFDVTPEPAGDETLVDGGRRFCVQKHAATRLHYDFRIEMDGVLKSWAVTKGPSFDPGEKRLAVRTEDHPVSYGDFEGTIPKHEYGGGTVMLWDEGRWSPTKDDPQTALETGELTFTLHGDRLKGEWALVRLKNKKNEKRENWLLIKKRDAAAEDGEEPTETYTRSVKTGRTMSQIEEGEKPNTKKAASKSKGGRPPKFESPVLCKLVDEVPSGEGWIHEMKYDGYRLIAAVGGGKSRLFTRNEKDWTEKFSGLADALEQIDCSSALIDGEAAVLDEDGLTDFSALQNAFKGDDRAEIALFCFDLLKLDGEDLRNTPLVERKKKLAQLLNGAPDALRYADHVSEDGDKVFERACEAGAEGVISKKADSTYKAGRDGRWRKIKCDLRDDAVIVGWSPSDKKDRPFASLILATCEDGDWVYRGRVGTGFDAETREALIDAMKKIERKTSPLDAVPSSVEKDAHWVTPKLVAVIRYTERTGDGAYRHPAFLGLREDLPAEEISAEPIETARKTKKS
ncbi:MAG: non-homologous end-joining DNA ligase [Oceanicaulis sp.]